ncbi:MAG: hypothetical protein R2813_14075 [Flavobacteriales bacterium]
MVDSFVKKLLMISSVVFVLLMFGSCANEKVVSEGFIQKRKYRSGFHFADFCKTKSKSEVGYNIGPIRLDRHESNAPNRSIETYVSPNNSQVAELNEKAPVAKTKFSGSNTFQEVLVINSGSEAIQNSSLVEEEPEPKEHQIRSFWPGLVAMLLSIIGLVGFAYIPFFGLFFSSFALVFAIKAIKTRDRVSTTLGVVSLVITGFTFLIALLITTVIAIDLGLFFIP